MRTILAAVFVLLLVPSTASADSVNCLGGFSIPEGRTESVVCTFPGFKLAVRPGTITMIQQGTMRTPSDKIIFKDDPKTGVATITFESDVDGLGKPVGTLVFEPASAQVPLIPLSGKGPGIRVVFKSDKESGGGASDVITTVPEPSTLLLMGTGLLCIGTSLGRKRNKSARDLP